MELTAIQEKQLARWKAPLAEQITTQMIGAAGVVVPHMTNQEYHDQKWAVSFSTLKQFHKTPLHYLWAMENENPASKALRQGTLIHRAILEPDQFRSCYISDLHLSEDIRSLNKNTKAYKEAKAALLQKYPHAELITEEEAKAVEMTLENLKRHHRASKLLSNGTSELACFAKDPHTGAFIRAKFDYIRADICAIVDVKTTASVDIKDFQRAVLDYFYMVQMAHYQIVASQAFDQGFPNVFWVAIESKPPYAVRVFQAPKDYLEMGAVLRLKWLAQYAECLSRGEWNGYPSEIEMMPSVPRWWTDANFNMGDL